MRLGANTCAFPIKLIGLALSPISYLNESSSPRTFHQKLEFKSFQCYSSIDVVMAPESLYNTGMDAIPFPTLETQRLVLRRLTPRDAEGILSLYSQDEVVRFIALEALQTTQQAAALIDRYDRLVANSSGIRWGIFTREDGRLIGTCGYHDWDQRRCLAEISFELLPGFHDQEDLQAALQAVLAYGFEQMSLRRVESLVDLADTHTQNMLSSLGFHMEGILREHDFIKGQFLDDILYSLLLDDWPGSNR